MDRIKRVVATLSLSALMVLMMVATALGQVTPNAELGTAITGAADEVEVNVLAILPTVLAVAALLMVISIAWKFFRRFVR